MKTISDVAYCLAPESLGRAYVMFSAGCNGNNVKVTPLHDSLPMCMEAGNYQTYRNYTGVPAGNWVWCPICYLVHCKQV